MAHIPQERMQINKWMQQYDKQVEAEETLIEAIRNKPDEDGWVKVIAARGKRHLPPLRESDLQQQNENAKKVRNLKLKQELSQQIPLYKHQRQDAQKQRMVAVLMFIYNRISIVARQI